MGQKQKNLLKIMKMEKLKSNLLLTLVLLNNNNNYLKELRKINLFNIISELAR